MHFGWKQTWIWRNNSVMKMSQAVSWLAEVAGFLFYKQRSKRCMMWYDNRTFRLKGLAFTLHYVRPLFDPGLNPHSVCRLWTLKCTKSSAGASLCQQRTSSEQKTVWELQIFQILCRYVAPSVGGNPNDIWSNQIFTFTTKLKLSLLQ